NATFVLYATVGVFLRYFKVKHLKGLGMAVRFPGISTAFPDSLRVHRVFFGTLGAIYCVAFLSLAVQITGLIGSRGILPLGLPHVGDAGLKLACAAGAAFSVLLAAGILRRVWLVVCWALYLALVTAGQDFMSFQWDILLLESGFLAIFLGS